MTNPLSQTEDILFFDDFTSEELDRTKWNVDITGKIVNNEKQAYIDSNETLFLTNTMEDAKGVLVIQPRYRPGFTSPQGDVFDFVSGRINTRVKFEFTYGNIAARIKLPQGVGLWPAFWALGSRGNWPTCGELDVMEYVGEPDWTSAAVHGPLYSGEAGLVNRKYFINPDSATQWHIYALDWTKDNLYFTVDDQLIFRVTRPNVEFFGAWVFNKPHFIILNFALGGTYPYKINGINQPYYGIPQTTVRSIQQNEIRMLVDWVRVCKTIRTS